VDPAILRARRRGSAGAGAVHPLVRGVDHGIHCHWAIKIEAEARINASPEVVLTPFTTGPDAWWPNRTLDDAVIVYEAAIGGRVNEDGVTSMRCFAGMWPCTIHPYNTS
jgi:hypothetical protein